MHSIVFLDRKTLGPNITVRRPSFPHQWREFDRTSAAQVVDRLKDVDIAITNKVAINSQALDELPNLKHIAVAATGTNVVDLAACKVKGISVSNIQAYAMQSVPEFTFAAMLGLRRRLFQYREEVQQGVWQQEDQFCFFNEPIYDLAGSTLGIIGTGSIAIAVGKIANAFSMRVLYHSPSGRNYLENGELVDLKTLCARSDIISIHCPLNDKTNGMIDASCLSLMKPTALLINTARGDIISLSSLKHALDTNVIAGAALDVLPKEPPDAADPIMALTKSPNFLLTPHIAWASEQAMQTLADQLIDNVEALVKDQPQHIVN